MDKEHYIFFLFLLIPFVYSGLRLILYREIRTDIKDSKEDGYLKRFKGAIIEYFREEENIHRIVLEAPDYAGKKANPKFSFMEINGCRRTILYQIPLQNDPVPLYSFYENEMKAAGFKILYSDYGNERLGYPRDWYKQVFITGKNLFAWSDLASIMQGKLLCYFSGIKEDENGKVFISVFAVNHFRNNKRTGVFIFVSGDQ